MSAVSTASAARRARMRCRWRVQAAPKPRRMPSSSSVPTLRKVPKPVPNDPSRAPEPLVPCPWYRSRGGPSGLGRGGRLSSTQRQPGAQTRERLIESHLPLVKALARRYAGADAEMEDLVQVGAVGLLKASDRFDPTKGVAFATFATPTIEGEIRHHLRDRGSGMRIPRQLQRLSSRIHSRQAELAVSLGRSPTVAEI